MTLPADAGFRAAVTESHTPARELWTVRNGQRVEELPIDSGTSIQVAGNLVRRSGTVVIPNPDGLYTPGAGIIDFDVAFLLRFGVLTSTGWQWCEQPLLYPDSDESAVGSRQVTIAVSDGMRIVSANAQLSAPLNFPDSSPLEDLVRSALVACGAPDDDAYFDLNAAGAVLSGDYGFEAGARWADILTQALTDYSLDLWAAPPLVYTLRPIPDPLVAPVAATWAIGREVRLLDLKVRRSNLARNHAIVSGVDLFGNPVAAEVFDVNPDSPVQWGKPGVGDLSVTYHSDGISTVDQAVGVGTSLLASRAVQTDLEATVPIDPSLDRRDVVLVDDGSGIGLRYMLDSFDLPSAPGSQTISVQQARSLE